MASHTLCSGEESWLRHGTESSQPRREQEKLLSVINNSRRATLETSWSPLRRLQERRHGGPDLGGADRFRGQQKKEGISGTVTARLHAWRDTGCFQNREASTRRGENRKSSCEGKWGLVGMSGGGKVL